jgi:hypothetical protein
MTTLARLPAVEAWNRHVDLARTIASIGELKVRTAVEKRLAQVLESGSQHLRGFVFSWRPAACLYTHRATLIRRRAGARNKDSCRTISRHPRIRSSIAGTADDLSAKRIFVDFGRLTIPIRFVVCVDSSHAAFV